MRLPVIGSFEDEAGRAVRHPVWRVAEVHGFVECQAYSSEGGGFRAQSSRIDSSGLRETKGHRSYSSFRAFRARSASGEATSLPESGWNCFPDPQIPQ
jgi:hypothetical protein